MRTFASLCHSNNILWSPGNAAKLVHNRSISLQIGNNIYYSKRALRTHERAPCVGTMCTCAISGEPHEIQRSDLGSSVAERQSVGSQLNASDDSSEVNKEGKERRRRRRKKHGNTGRIPWNKGIKHSAETRALIKLKTIEALKDPQVRKKMAEHARPHSDENKAKISSGLLRNWEKRLKVKRLREKFFISWALSIAEAGRKGGVNQRELNWNKCEKSKREITLYQLSCKQTKKQKAQKNIKKSESLELGEKGRKQGAACQAKDNSMLKTRKKHGNALKMKKDSSACKSQEHLSFGGLSLKKKLTKIRRKKLTFRPVHQMEALVSSNPAWDKLDMELLGERDIGVKVSLAEQIKVAKSKRKSC